MARRWRRGFGTDSSEDLRRLDRVVRDLEALGVEPGVEIEIVRALLRGRRTVPELVETIYDLDHSSEDFHAHYMRVWRSVRELEARGIVSAPILGRDKAYRLTGHGLGLLLGISQGKRSTRTGIFSRPDVCLFALAFALGALYSADPGRFSPLLLVFVFVLGVSTCRILVSLRGVW